MDDAIWGVFQEGWRDGFGRRRRPPQDDRGHRHLRGGRLHAFHHRPRRARGQRGRHRRRRPTLRAQSRGSALGRPGNLAPTTSSRAMRAEPFDLEAASSSPSTRRCCCGRRSSTAARSRTPSACIATWTRSWASAPLRARRCRWTRPTRPPSPPSTTSSPASCERLGVQWVSLAPRFVGRFEKGVDYIGDLDAFERASPSTSPSIAHAGAVQDQPPLRLGQVQRLPDRGAS